jgi:hypothetical protein
MRCYVEKNECNNVIIMIYKVIYVIIYYIILVGTLYGKCNACQRVSKRWPQTKIYTKHNLVFNKI